MTKHILISICLLLVATVSHADDHTAIEYSWLDYHDWYYKQSVKYQGWKYIVIHHSATNSGSVKAFDKYHTQQGYGGVAYHFVIGNGSGMGDGEVKATFRWEQQISGTHVSVNSWDHNVFGIGIVLVGNFENSLPSVKQLQALAELIDDLQRQFGITDEQIIGHRHVRFDDASGRTEQTVCPGKKLDIKQVKLQKVVY